MSFQTVFKRYELKYLLTQKQKEKVLAAMAPYMKLDQYGRTTIRNIYYDTDTYLLVRRSIEKPAYKEKLRLRSYNQAAPDSTVFVELKKKYQGIVYKRRILMSEGDAEAWLGGRQPCGNSTQISAEIEYFKEYYKTLQPRVFLSYAREAYFTEDDFEFRITFDDTILCRLEDLSLRAEIYGTPILPEGNVLMEVKCAGSIPLWLVNVLSEERIYKTTFSKYGTAYKKIIFPQISGAYHM